MALDTSKTDVYQACTSPAELLGKYGQKYAICPLQQGQPY
jgi:hypothetical protein